MRKHKENESTPISPIDQEQFLPLRTPEFKAVYSLYAASKDPQEAHISIASHLSTSYGISEKAAQALSTLLIDAMSASPQQKRDTPQKTVPVSFFTPKTKITVSMQDYTRFTEQVLSKSATPQQAALLFSFLIFYRRNFHKTGWIRYNKKAIFYLASADKLPMKEQENLTAELHNLFGLDMRVIGSNQPIPCFALPWAYEQPQTGTDKNPMIELGTMTPQDVKNIIDKILRG